MVRELLFSKPEKPRPENHRYFHVTQLMKTKHAISTCLVIVCGFAAALHAQTPPLTPSGPPSDPATAMKSLNQVEPRTPIGSLPFTITQPGSYYFTKNLEFTAATGDAITVNARNVTIDLMGFTLSSTSAVTGSGIATVGGTSGLTVKNGTIAGTTTVDESNWTTVKGGFESGVNGIGFHGSRGYHITKLTITGCRSCGLVAASNSIVEDVVVTECGGGGILATFGVVRSCNVFANSGGTHGIYAAGGIISNSASIVNQGIGVEAQTILNVTAEGNAYAGIKGDIVHNSNSSHNGGVGIFGSQVANCSATANDQRGIDAISVSHSLTLNNGGVGILINGLSGVVAFCTSSGNTDSQIVAPVGATKTGNSPAP